MTDADFKSGKELQPATLVAVPVSKPAALPNNRPASPGRRHFLLSWFGLGWIAFILSTTGALSILVRYIFPNVLFEPKTVFRAGFPDDYEVGKVDTRWKDKYRVWIIRTREGIYVLLAICTHLGCTPNWLQEEQKFKCPCHGSGFYKSGINFEGPAPRPLERVAISRADDGQILIDTSKRFQQEKGEWKNPGSFLTV